MRRRSADGGPRPRRFVIRLVVVCVLVLSVTVVAFLVGRRDSVPSGALEYAPPEFVRSFAGDGTERLLRPIGVLAVGESVLVSDTRLGSILRFSLDGDLLGTFGEGTVRNPLFMAENPRDGNVYVSDRGKGALHVFTPAGEYVGEFAPDLEGEPPSTSAGLPRWDLGALAFAPDGSLFVTETREEHRLLVFNPSGVLERSIGTRGTSDAAEEATEGATGETEVWFEFPSGIEVVGGEVWVADSGNHRIQVFDLDGDFLRAIASAGLPRGLAVLPGNDEDPDGPESGSHRVAVVNTTANEVTILDSDGDEVSSFGAQGGLDGEFAFPTDIATGPEDLLFVTDTANARVQVWRWPRRFVLPSGFPWHLLLVAVAIALGLPVSLWLSRRRRRKYFATRDFVEALLKAGLVHRMPGGRRRWLVSPEDYESLKDEREGDLRLGDILESSTPSASDVRALEERFRVGNEVAVKLAIAGRAKYVCTDDPRIRGLSRLLGRAVLDSKRWARQSASNAPRMTGESGQHRD